MFSYAIRARLMSGLVRHKQFATALLGQVDPRLDVFSSDFSSFAVNLGGCFRRFGVPFDRDSVTALSLSAVPPI